MTLLFLVLSGLATGASWLCYFHALQKGDINKVVPIDKSSTILTILLALIFLHEGLSWAKAGCVCLIGIGTMMMITRKETTDETTAKDGSWLIYAVLSAVFASLTAILGKIGISGIDSSLGTAIRTTVVLAMAWLMVFMKGKQHEVGKIEKKELLFIGLSGIATGVMLGLSRVIGETMVVLMVAGGAALIPESLFDPVRPMPASIVAEMAESPFGSSHYHALFAIGIVLFFFTFLCNLAAFLVSQKYKLKASN